MSQVTPAFSTVTTTGLAALGMACALVLASCVYPAAMVLETEHRSENAGARGDSDNATPMDDSATAQGAVGNAEEEAQSSLPSLEPPVDPQQGVTDANNDLGWRLLESLAEQDTDDNVLISPLGIAANLTMLYHGASGGTLTAMGNTLGISDLRSEDIVVAYQSLLGQLSGADPDIQLNWANSIWYREEFAVEAGFVDTNETCFDATVAPLDFGSDDAAEAINTWVRHETHQLIDSVVEPPIDPLTVLFSVNAIHFTGAWTISFDRSTTTQATFSAPDRDITVDMMHANHADILFPYIETATLQAVDLPYGGGRFRMMVVLPAPGAVLRDVTGELSRVAWADWVDSLALRRVNLALPKFALDYDTSMVAALSALGMEVAFDMDRAEFARVRPQVQLYISEVRHRTSVRVDEEGTQVAAAVSEELTQKGSRAEMLVDRPFVIVLHDIQTRAILLVGTVAQP